MKSHFYLPSFLLLLIAFCITGMGAQAQSCAVQFTYTTTESRCMSTGSITITATGGSGIYNYKVEGPAAPPYTSSNVITGLPAGTYKVTVKDITNNCVVEKEGVVVTGSYSDPRYELIKTDATCAGNDGSISVNNLQNGRSPFTYRIIAPSPYAVGTFSSDGHFTNLIPGTYYVQLQDSCGGIQVRNITVDGYSWQFDTYSITRSADCKMADAVVQLKDNKGNTNTSGTVFTGFNYGVVLSAGDTGWYNNRTFSFALNTYRQATLVVKDNCGNIKSVLWKLADSNKPSVNATAGTGNFTCNDFTATVSGQQNLTSPDYCLYDNNDKLISCNTTGIFTAVPYGAYYIKITDHCYDTTITRTVSASRPVPLVNSSVTISNRTCTTFTANITGQVNLTNPAYCLYDNANNQLQCNSTGVFDNLLYGSYTIKITDGCTGTVISRTFAASKLLPALNALKITSNGCTTFGIKTNGGSNLTGATYCLYNASGNVVTCNTTGIFDNLPYGYYCVKATNDCGDVSAPVCITGQRPKPSIGGTVSVSNIICSGFTATITGQNALTSPTYCLYDNANKQVQCNNTGVFTNIPYGSYCIKITDGCYDTTITRCFTQSHTVPSINATINATNLSCATFTATISGSNLTSPQYYLYDNKNNLVATNSTGVFNNVPYGSYCGKIKDGCVDTTMSVCQTVTLNKSITVTAIKTCTIDATTLQVTFASPNSPYTITVYNPDGTMAKSGSTTNTTSSITDLPALFPGQQYKVVGTDNCGNKDAVYVTPVVSQITKKATVTAKCPSAAAQDGSGDIVVTCSSNYNTVTPTLIKKDGMAFSKAYTYNNGAYTFSDLGTGTYVVQYAVQNCAAKVYDTITIQPYTFPRQDQSAIYQCNDNSFSVGSAVVGGVAPYQYEIIGSIPESPSVVMPKQSSPVFNINNGTTYSLIRLRSTDACGNAALSDASVLPLQNVMITSNTQCLYQNVTLSVDSIPNASYQWYCKRTTTDSSLVGTERMYNFPFLEQEQIGTYVCKVSVNSNCLTRLAYFELTGECGQQFLAVPVRLTGSKTASGNQLSWVSDSEQYTAAYIIERKSPHDNNYREIGTVYPQPAILQNRYLYADSKPAAGVNMYRIKVVYRNRRTAYSNAVPLSSGEGAISVYPNPAKDALYISLGDNTINDYQLTMYNNAGQLVYRQALPNTAATIYTYKRSSTIKAGMYLLKIANTTTGAVQLFKVLFE